MIPYDYTENRHRCKYETMNFARHRAMGYLDVIGIKGLYRVSCQSPYQVEAGHRAEQRIGRR